MVATTTHFTKQKAPCGRMADGDNHVESDDDGFAYDLGKNNPEHRHPLPYDSMPLEDIIALPVEKFVDRDGCALFFWTTTRYLPASFEIVAAWGFKYTQTTVWKKTNPNHFGGSVAPNGRTATSHLRERMKS